MCDSKGSNMKVDAELIKKLTINEANIYEEKDLFSSEQKKQKAFIHHMINERIPFCALVSGFRGTGKSVLVDYIFDEFKECKCDSTSNKNIVACITNFFKNINKKNNTNKTPNNKKVLVVNFNATKYTKYGHFLRKIIRELYLAADKQKCIEDNIEGLRDLYIHTFNTVIESDTSIKNTKTNKKISAKLSGKLSGKIAGTMQVIINFIFIILIIFFNKNDISILGIQIPFKIVSSILVGISFILSFCGIYNHSKSLKHRNLKQIESLYDEEIAEYKLFSELKKLHDNDITVVLIVDELDKLNDTEVEKIVCDLKPLLLSNFCDSVLVAGINFDKKLIDESTLLDSVSSSLFSYRIYVPLGSLTDFEQLATVISGSDISFEREDSDSDNYYRLKAMQTRGVKRNFINSILADSYSTGKAIFLDSSKVDMQISYDDLSDYYEVLSYFEQSYISELFSDQEYLRRDLSLKYAYYYISYMIQGNEKSNHIPTIREHVDNFINKNSRKDIKKYLSEENRDEIITILRQDGANSNPDQGDNNPSPNPTVPPAPISPIKITTMEELDYLHVFSEHSLSYFVNDVLKELDRLMIPVNKNYLKDFCKILYYFSSYQHISINEISKKLLKIYKAECIDNISVSGNLFATIFNSKKGTPEITEFIITLMKLFYFNSETANISIDKGWLRRNTSFDIIDKTNSNAMQIRYYKSKTYLEKYESNRLYALKTIMKSNAEKSQISRICMVVFSLAFISSDEWKPYSEENGEITSKMLLVNLSDYDNFVEGMNSVNEYFNRPQNNNSIIKSNGVDERKSPKTEDA